MAPLPEQMQGDLQTHFDQTLERGRRIEPRDWVPDAYRATMIRQIAQHATRRSSACSRRVTGSPRAFAAAQAILIAKVQDEAGHGMYLYSAPRRSVPTGPTSPTSLSGGGRSTPRSSITHADLRGRRRDRLAGRRRGHLQPGAAVRSSYGPYARPWCVSARRNPSTSGRIRAADDHDAGHRGAARDAQDATNRFWWPSLMMFGPPDDQSPNTAQSMAWASSGTPTTSCGSASWT